MTRAARSAGLLVVFSGRRFFALPCDGGLDCRIPSGSQLLYPNLCLPQLPKVIGSLVRKPAFWRGAQSLCQPHCHFGGECTAAINYLRQRLPAHSQGLGCRGNTDTHRVQPQALQNFTGMGRVMHLHESLSIIVLVVDALGITANEAESDPPICLNRDRPNAFSRALKLMQT